MSSHLNKVMLLGNVGKDPEVNNFDSGKLAKFTLATTERYTDKSGNKQEETTWHNVQAWGPLAELIEKYVSKGKLIMVEGKIKNRSWEDKDGVKKFATDILASNVLFLSPKSSGSSEGTASSSNSGNAKSSSSKKSSAPTQSAPEPSMSEISNDTEDDLPF